MQPKLCTQAQSLKLSAACLWCKRSLMQRYMNMSVTQPKLGLNARNNACLDALTHTMAVGLHMGYSHLKL